MKSNVNILDRNIPARTLIFSLVMPSFIEEFMQILTMYVDTAMVGHISVNASAAIAVNNPIVNLTNGFNYGLALGFSVMIARLIGENNKKDAENVIRNAMFHILWFGLFLVALYSIVLAPNYVRWMKADPEIWAESMSYLRILGYSRIFLVMLSCCCNLMRGMGDTKHPMYCNISHNICNVILNFFLIYPTRTITLFGTSFTMIGAGKGVAGAAMATSLSNVVSALMSLYFLFTRNYPVRVPFAGCWVPYFPLIKRIYRLGIPISIERLVINSGQIATTRMLSGLGNTALSAHSMANTAESICYMPVNGFAVASTTIVAQWLGAGDQNRAVELGNKCIKYSVVTMFFCATTMFIFAKQIIGIMIPDRAVIDMAAQALRIQACAEIFVAIAITTGGILRGAGDTNFSSVMAIAGMWCVRVPLAFILTKYFSFGLNGIWLPMALDWTVRCLLTTVRYRRGKWKQAWK